MKKQLLLLAFALTLAACSTPVVQPTPISSDTFEEDFSKDTGIWQTFTETGGSAKIVDGQMDIVVGSPFTVSLSIAALNLADFDLTLITTPIINGTANGYGVIFRYLDLQNFYRFDVGGDGKWGVSRRLRDQWLHLSELKVSPAIKTGTTPNTLRIVARADKFEFYANGTLLGTISDANLPLGRIGIFASTFDDAKTEIKFDNIRVSKP